MNLPKRERIRAWAPNMCRGGNDMCHNSRGFFRVAGRLVGCWMLLGCWCGLAWADGKPAVHAKGGQMLFARVWQVDDSQAKGDGLGPLFNERSCVACHFLGGMGGAGPNENNVALLTFITDGVINVERTQAELTALHPGFADGTTVVLHRFSSRRAQYNAFCSKLLGRVLPEHDDPIRWAFTAGTIPGEESLRTGQGDSMIAGKSFELSEPQHHPHVRRGLDRQHSRGRDRKRRRPGNGSRIPTCMAFLSAALAAAGRS